MLLVDPEKQDDEQIAHIKAAKARVDAALEPLTIQEANFLHKHKDTIDLFTSRQYDNRDRLRSCGKIL
jgi:hypothetical protein